MLNNYEIKDFSEPFILKKSAVCKISYKKNKLKTKNNNYFTPLYHLKTKMITFECHCTLYLYSQPETSDFRAV